MERYDFALRGDRIHRAVEGSIGGTSLGLHLAAGRINGGQRVLWASVEMPDPARFSQLFQHLSLVESSRFHAMNLADALTVPLMHRSKRRPRSPVLVWWCWTIAPG